VDYHGLRGDLRGELLKIGVDIGRPPMGNKARYVSRGCRTIILWGLKSSSPAAYGAGIGGAPTAL
jgi:hypothetical protein